MELELLTAEEAERKPAGVAHEEPEALAAPKWVPLILIRLTRDRAVSFVWTTAVDSTNCLRNVLLSSFSLVFVNIYYQALHRNDSNISEICYWNFKLNSANESELSSVAILKTKKNFAKASKASLITWNWFTN